MTSLNTILRTTVLTGITCWTSLFFLCLPPPVLSEGFGKLIPGSGYPFTTDVQSALPTLEQPIEELACQRFSDLSKFIW